MLREVVSRVRTEARLSQRELSARVGMPHTHLTRVESGGRTLDVVEFLDIIRAVGRDPAEVFAVYLACLAEH